MEAHKRDIDIVIQNENNMKLFLVFLIYSLNTVDGKRGTAEKLIKLKTEILKSDSAENVKSFVYEKILFKYLVLKIRMKISFTALTKCMTIKELLLKGILKAYQI